MTAKIANILFAKLKKEEKLREVIKSQKIVKAGETILMDLTIDLEEEQAEDYVIAPESAAEIDSIANELESKLTLIFLDPVKTTPEIS